MDPYEVLNFGEKYSKKDLSNLLNQSNISLVREGIFNCKNSSSSLFLEEDFFHWDSQTTQHIGSPRIKINYERPITLY